MFLNLGLAFWLRKTICSAEKERERRYREERESERGERQELEVNFSGKENEREDYERPR